MSKAFHDLIFTGTVRSFYSKGRAEAFRDEVSAKGYNVALEEDPKEDLRWKVTVLGERSKKAVTA